jgi:hypothetical protein
MRNRHGRSTLTHSRESKKGHIVERKQSISQLKKHVSQGAHTSCSPPLKSQAKNKQQQEASEIQGTIKMEIHFKSQSHSRSQAREKTKTRGNKTNPRQREGIHKA